jgi:hypothetical protein
MPLGDKPTGLHVQSKKRAVEKPCRSFNFLVGSVFKLSVSLRSNGNARYCFACKSDCFDAKTCALAIASGGVFILLDVTRRDGHVLLEPIQEKTHRVNAVGL